MTCWGRKNWFWVFLVWNKWSQRFLNMSIYITQILNQTRNLSNVQMRLFNRILRIKGNERVSLFFPKMMSVTSNKPFIYIGLTLLSKAGLDGWKDWEEWCCCWLKFPSPWCWSPTTNVDEDCTANGLLKRLDLLQLFHFSQEKAHYLRIFDPK